MNNFLEQMRIKCEAKAKDMARLELKHWDEKHERELIQHFGFTVKSLAKRKAELLKDAA